VSRKSRSQEEGGSATKRESYDPDAVKAERLPPLEAAATFLSLCRMGTLINLAMGRDSYELWRRSKGYRS
jgi:hypothetical protein